MKCHGPNCRNELVKATTGRPPRYCSDACKQAAYRNRKWEREQPKRLADELHQLARQVERTLNHAEHSYSALSRTKVDAMAIATLIHTAAEAVCPSRLDASWL
jgi:hypothetical protein